MSTIYRIMKMANYTQKQTCDNINRQNVKKSCSQGFYTINDRFLEVQVMTTKKKVIIIKSSFVALELQQQNREHICTE